MGCSFSCGYFDKECMYVKSESEPSDMKVNFDDHYFTQRQKQLIRESWAKATNNQEDKGVKIFLTLFEIKPDAKQLFPFRHLSGDTLLKDPTFRCHANRFIHAIGNTVQHLDALDVSCAPTLVLLGRKHAWIDTFMTGGYLEAFVESLATVFKEELSGSETGEVYEAWRALFTFLTNKLCEGYKEMQTPTKESGLLNNGSTENNSQIHLNGRHTSQVDQNSIVNKGDCEQQSVNNTGNEITQTNNSENPYVSGITKVNGNHKPNHLDTETEYNSLL